MCRDGEANRMKFHPFSNETWREMKHLGYENELKLYKGAYNFT